MTGAVRDACGVREAVLRLCRPINFGRWLRFHRHAGAVRPLPEIVGEVVGEIGHADLRPGAGEPDGPHEEVHAGIYAARRRAR